MIRTMIGTLCIAAPYTYMAIMVGMPIELILLFGVAIVGVFLVLWDDIK